MTVGVIAIALTGIYLLVRSPGGDRAQTGELTEPTLVLADPMLTYDPVRDGEPLPDDFRPVLRRDVISPVYDPVFVTAESVDWGPETLVVGVALEGEAKAYPVNYMNVHEMVNDRIANTPILVSW